MMTTVDDAIELSCGNDRCGAIIRKLRDDKAEWERIALETTTNFRDLRIHADALEKEVQELRSERDALRVRVTRMMSGVVDGVGSDVAYSRLVANLTADELEGVVPRVVKDAGAADGGVGAMVAAIGVGSEEGVV
jgi:hypothetical protein